MVEELASHIHSFVVLNDPLIVEIVDKVQLLKAHSVDTCVRLTTRLYFEQNPLKLTCGVVVWNF